ncbi:PREDICTED: probable acyl-[acyl-carrier-protein]--UDP-N-acetylglucosamine O-acyltransferase, mitochondrial [Brassica oleracea var. oleracea]|uniref:probable acyl-[acyl-carrier-protein]--UDP-N-acetylglucosamine O-acyltransferase, mitochondrial n=1 Tax=Brassica oleracea var. oleracea TaxID=109376 RepID=UPI0006A73EFA|nr:PREDICTED: probable acyl-[acyl-carrier-protein]--UDP-N-acetylglucosamine O-acyltransferase, mitochondrial [Brassica oleracea var. oleracea]
MKKRRERNIGESYLNYSEIVLLSNNHNPSRIDSTDEAYLVKLLRNSSADYAGVKGGDIDSKPSLEGFGSTEVSVGPYCTVGSSVKVGNGCELYPSSHIFGNTELGESCVLMTGAVVVGDELPGYTVIGGNNIIGHHAVVGVKCQHLKYKVSSTSSETIGDHNIFANNTLLNGHVIVQDYTHTAGATVIHQFCHIGPYAFIGGGSVISQDVPKYMMVTGERAKLRGLILEGLRRNGFTMSEMKSLRAAYRKIFMSTETVLKS